MDNKTIETAGQILERHLKDYEDNQMEVGYSRNKAVINAMEEYRLSSQHPQGIDELIKTFKKALDKTLTEEIGKGIIQDSWKEICIKYAEIGFYFGTHLSNDAEVKELRAEIERLKTEIKSWAKDSNTLSDKLGGYSRFCIKTFGGHGSDFLETKVNELQAEISDLKSKLEQQGVSDYIINDYLITLEKCHCVFDDMCLNRAVDMLEVNLLMNKIEVILNTNPPKTN